MIKGGNRIYLWFGDHSDEIGSGQQRGEHFLSFHHLSTEFGTLFGVLEDRRDLDGTGPVDVVETLREDEFLEMTLFDFALAVDHLVVVGHNTSLGRLLTDDVEIVVLADYLSIDECPWRHVSDLLTCSEEPLTISEIDHDNSELHV